MPCRSDHMNATSLEVQGSQAACLLDELDGKQFDRSSWTGYHPRVYNKVGVKGIADTIVAELCERLQRVDVTKYSLEMQIWWRDHQEADRRREEAERQQLIDAFDRAAALAKLTPREKALLGLK